MSAGRSRRHDDTKISNVSCRQGDSRRQDDTKICNVSCRCVVVSARRKSPARRHEYLLCFVSSCRRLPVHIRKTITHMLTLMRIYITDALQQYTIQRTFMKLFFTSVYSIIKLKLKTMQFQKLSSKTLFLPAAEFVTCNMWTV